MQSTLIATGDILTTQSLKPFLRSGTSVYEPVLAMLKSADITFGNLEVCLTRNGHPVEKPVNLRANISVAAEIGQAGVDIVTVANNHSLDFGYEGLRETLRALESAGIRHVGGGKNLRDALAPVTLSRKGIRISYLGFSSCLPLGAEAGATRPGIAPVRVSTAYEIDPGTLLEQPGTVPVVRTSLNRRDVSLMEKATQQAKMGADLLIVAIHWGVAFQDRLAEYQRTLAHAIVDAGADLVIGHHPHVPHGVEVYQHKVIFYSLGNFVMQFKIKEELSSLFESIGIDLEKEDANGAETFIVRATIDRNGKACVQMIPIVIDDRGFPRLADDTSSQRVLKKIKRLSAGMARIDVEGGIGIVRGL
jgi:poly-gamma-glutamate capsule biosynthesis protein CapA/YwtB (metallophosphatase superfamily)